MDLRFLTNYILGNEVPVGKGSGFREASCPTGGSEETSRVKGLIMAIEALPFALTMFKQGFPRPVADG